MSRGERNDQLKRRELLSLLGGAALSPFAASLLHAEPSDRCGIPLERNDGLPLAAADEDKLIDRAALCRMADRLASSTNIHSVLVMRGGRLVFERYLRGDDEVPGHVFGRRVVNIAFAADTLHDIKSATKSITSLAFGIALDRGLIGRLNQPIFDFFPELSDLRTPEKDKMLLSNVLTMSMGLKWEEATPETGNFHNDERRMYTTWDPCRYVLGLPVTAPAGEVFFYNSGALMLLSEVLRKATKQPLDEFVREALFQPLGITSFEWGHYRGYTDAGGGLRLRTRDMARIGQLVLAGGNWNGRQIVSKAWIDASTAWRLKADEYQSYGYLWWLGSVRAGKRVVTWIGALGRGGQTIRIVPELNLIVAVTAGYYQDYSEDAFKTQFSVFRDVVRAVPQAG